MIGLMKKARPRPLDDGFAATFDRVVKNSWDDILGRFADANIYQTWSYDAVRCGEANISHLVLCKNGVVCAVAQARIVRLPVIGVGAAYLRWSPVWQRSGVPPDLAVLRAALRALRNEYVCRRGLILRIFPLLYNRPSAPYAAILAQEGYIPVPDENPGRTLVMDIGSPLDVVRKQLDQKWRNCLNRAERNQLNVKAGTEDTLFAEFIAIYRSMLERKKFVEPNDINEFRMVQQDLPSECKMRIFLSGNGHTNSAGAICTAIGETGVYLFGATNAEGMSNKGSYLLQWQAIQWMKENGCRYYNLNGINPAKNPGGYHFKAGLSAKNGCDLSYLGRYDCYPNRWAASLVRLADRFMPKIKATLGKVKRSR